MNNRSFTLVELLVVMLIIVIMTGAIFSSVGYVNRRAGEVKTRALLAKIGLALEQYKADWGEYPLAGSNMWDRTQVQTNFNCWLLTNLSGAYSTGPQKQYIQWAQDETNIVVASGVVALYIVDAFGTPICYDPCTTNTANRGNVPNGRVNFMSYDLWSFGADLKSPTIDPSQSTTTYYDDIKNWD